MHDKQKRNFQDHLEKHGLAFLGSGSSMGKYRAVVSLKKNEETSYRWADA
jgi:hypothetical protein